MSSFASAHGDSTSAQAPAGATSGQILVKPVPWQLESKFKMMTVLKPAPLIAANATLEQDKATILRCWLDMGGEDDILRRKYMAVDSGWSMRDEPSDDVSEWFGVTVEGGRVTRLRWNQGLSGAIPAEIGALSALTALDLGRNKLNGAIPPTIGALSSLTTLDLSYNFLSGIVPYHLSNLLNLEYLNLSNCSLEVLEVVGRGQGRAEARLRGRCREVEGGDG
mmetsp:Transcript_29109/g.58128  ORF Transcript_29109/g.58128 Transcript_29109/m.58128 type:complete len:222 (-) Transcript_29109:480-1145(-)